MKGTKMIKNYPKYKVTENGDVWSYAQNTPKILTPRKTTQNGKYLQVSLYNDKCKINPKTNQKLPDQIYIHRLVWEAFRGEIPEGMTIDHIDNNQANNHIDNLQLMTMSENSLKANGKKRKLWDIRDQIIQEYKSGISQTKLAKKYNVSSSHIWRVIEGKTNRKINGKWVYIDVVQD